MAISPQDGGTGGRGGQAPRAQGGRDGAGGARRPPCRPQPAVGREAPAARGEARPAPSRRPAGARGAAAHPRQAPPLRGAGQLPPARARCRSRPRSAISTSAPRTEYHSDVSFSIRSEEPGAAAAGILGAITGIGGGGSAAEPDILFEYIRSQEIVAAIDAEIDLRAIYNRKPDGLGLLARRGRHDRGSARALAADGGRELREPLRHHPGARHRLHPRGRPEDHPGDPGEVDRAGEPPGRAGAHRRDPLRPGRPRRGRGAPARPAPGARELPPRAPDGRSRRPTWKGRWGSSTALQEELAKALVERDMLLTYAEPADQRVQQANRRITAISDRIENERTTLGAPGTAGKMPEVVGDFEALKVDLEFASQAYTQALANLAARPRRGAAAVALPRGARGADAGRALALSPPGAALGAGRALPRARLGRR